MEETKDTMFAKQPLYQPKTTRTVPNQTTQSKKADHQYFTNITNADEYVKSTFGG
jgi:hypothetical protein